MRARSDQLCFDEERKRPARLIEYGQTAVLIEPQDERSPPRDVGLRDCWITGPKPKDRIVLGRGRPKLLTTVRFEGSLALMLIDLLDADPSGQDPWLLNPARWSFGFVFDRAMERMLRRFQRAAMSIYHERQEHKQLSSVIDFLVDEAKSEDPARITKAWLDAERALAKLVDEGREDARSLLQIASTACSGLARIWRQVLIRKIIAGSLTAAEDAKCVAALDLHVQRGLLTPEEFEDEINEAEVWLRSKRLPAPMLTMHTAGQRPELHS